jgi:hypothetical protein
MPARGNDAIRRPGVERIAGGSRRDSRIRGEILFRHRPGLVRAKPRKDEQASQRSSGHEDASADARHPTATPAPA